MLHVVMFKKDLFISVTEVSSHKAQRNYVIFVSVPMFLFIVISSEKMPYVCREHDSVMSSPIQVKLYVFNAVSTAGLHSVVLCHSRLEVSCVNFLFSLCSPIPDILSLLEYKFGFDCMCRILVKYSHVWVVSVQYVFQSI
jgi:hypothetical protein